MFTIDVISLSGKIYSGEAFEVTLPTINGVASVLPRHMPIVTPLTVGEVVVKTKDKILNFSIGKGIFSFADNVASLLIEDVQSSDEISEEKALEAKKKAEEIIAKGVTPAEKEMAMYNLRRSLVDLNIVRKQKRKVVE